MNILILSRKGAGRGKTAAAFMRASAPEDVSIICAALDTPETDPMADEALAESRVDTEGIEVEFFRFDDSRMYDIVIAMDEMVRADCPVLPGAPPVVTWNVPDPGNAKGDSSIIDAAYRTSRDTIRHLARDFFARGYFEALTAGRRRFKSIMDNLDEGIIVHNNDKVFFYMNRAAEKITGYSLRDVMGRMCGDIFPDGFCGGKCSFKNGEIDCLDYRNYKLDFTTKDGELRRLDMTVIPFLGEEGERVGVIASFRDLTHMYELERRLGEKLSYAGIIGRDEKMLSVFDMMRDVAASEASTLILGETGTGKELVAATIHNESSRADKLFVPVNCGALPEGIIESELFGHVKGAFTGAVKDRKGRFELADGGTIFLDEVGELPPQVQVKLLRVLQEGTFERVGGEETLEVDVRIISATNRDLGEMMKQGKFREDLYYRLCVVPITLPPLRERRNDIPMLAAHFLEKLSEGTDCAGAAFAPECMSLLMDFDWPGNVRQLQNAIQFALVKCQGEGILKPTHLPPDISDRVVINPAGKVGRKKKLNQKMVKEALEKSAGNRVQAAKQLKVGRATLYRYLEEMK